MSEVVLDELKSHAGIEQMSGDRMAEPVAGVAAVNACQVAVPDEERLDLTLAKRPASPAEEGRFRGPLSVREVPPQETGGGREERLLGPGTTLEPLDDDAAALEVHVLTAEQRHLSHSQSVVVDQREERAVAAILDRGEESSEFELRQIAWEALRGPEDSGQRRYEVRK